MLNKWTKSNNNNYVTRDKFKSSCRHIIKKEAMNQQVASHYTKQINFNVQ